TLVTINDHDERAARRWFARAGLTICRVSGMGVDTRLFTPPTAEYRAEARRALGVDLDAVVIGWVGELDKGKRPLDALRVLAMLQTRVPEATLVLAGEGPLVRLVRQRAAALGWETTVLVAGWQADMPFFLAACDVLLSTSDREGLPKSIMEAMAMGMPVVAWQIRGCSDLIVDGVTGYLAPFGDVQVMAGRLESLAKCTEDRRRLGAAGRDRMLAEFGLKHILAQMRVVYEAVLSERSTG
ncbi:MAG: glycosyltransferase, partial [Caldiserica bacterium]|nr:glycosyltransferase [Caldisericota bacterium]